MKRLLLLLAVIAMPAWAQEDEADRAQRTRIAAERKQVAAAFQGEEKACYGKFAVNEQDRLVLEQYRRHPRPRSAGIVRTLAERGDERELFGGRR